MWKRLLPASNSFGSPSLQAMSQPLSLLPPCFLRSSRSFHSQASPFPHYMYTQHTSNVVRDFHKRIVMTASKMADEEAQLQQQQQQQPLLIPKSANDDDRRIIIQKAISQTFKSTAHLANLLPTGTVLAFQLLSPIFTNQGHCDPMSRFMTTALVALCGLSCFFQSFTDSFRDGSGEVRYGLATFRGLWVIDGTAPLPPEIAINYRIKFIDFVHAFMSILVFAAIALFDQSVVSCFYPNPSEEMKQVLTSLPIGIGVFGSMLFVTFPTTRHGIGFPLSSS